jgi:hypothetical protein
MRPIFPSRRCLPPEKPAGRALLRGFVRGCAATTGRWWPLPHVFIEVRKLRLDPVTARRCRGRFVGRMRFRGFCKCSVSTSTTTDHSNIPDHRIRGWDDSRSNESKLSIEGDRRRYAGPGVEKEPNLDIPHRDCSRRRLRPNPDRSGHLLSRAPPFALSGKTWGRERYRQHRACLHRRYDERVVRRLISAKKPDAHQPEGPSIARPSKRTVEALRSAQTVRSTCRRLFHQPRSGRGTLVWVMGGSVIQ